MRPWLRAFWCEAARAVLIAEGKGLGRATFALSLLLGLLPWLGERRIGSEVRLNAANRFGHSQRNKKTPARSGV
jgi:hypothetical protein